MTLFLFFLFGFVILVGWISLKTEIKYHKRHIANKNTQTPSSDTPKSKVQIPVIDGPASKLSYVHNPISKREGLVDEHPASNAEEAEAYVTRMLSTLGRYYIIYPNLIIDKTGHLKTTEIDHLVISTYGIFCIETKSHSGSIYGGAGSQYWKQYLAGKTYPLYNPLFQNRNHARSLGNVLGKRIKSRIHNFVIFPNAKVKVESLSVFSNVNELIEKIRLHQKMIYTQQEMTDMAYILAKYTHEYERRRGVHAQNVHNYLHTVS